MTRRVLAALLLPLAAVMILSRVGRGAGKDRTDAAEQAVRGAALQCYALEGAYPADMDYLYEHYGLAKDPGVIIYYEYVASNLMPEVTAARSGR